MTALTTAQALALLDALRAEVVANPDAVHLLVDWHPGMLAVHVCDYRQGPPYRLVEILQAAQSASAAEAVDADAAWIAANRYVPGNARTSGPHFGKVSTVFNDSGREVGTAIISGPHAELTYSIGYSVAEAVEDGPDYGVGDGEHR
jgi:hypothetical protein